MGDSQPNTDEPVKEEDPSVKQCYVSGLNWWTTDSQVESSLGVFGTVEELTMLEERKTGKFLGRVLVRFATKEDCDKAKQGIKDLEIDGKKCQVEDFKVEAPPPFRNQDQRPTGEHDQRRNPSQSRADDRRQPSRSRNNSRGRDRGRHDNRRERRGRDDKRPRDDRRGGRDARDEKRPRDDRHGGRGREDDRRRGRGHDDDRRRENGNWGEYDRMWHAHYNQGGAPPQQGYYNDYYYGNNGGW